MKKCLKQNRFHSNENAITEINASLRDWNITFIGSKQQIGEGQEEMHKPQKIRAEKYDLFREIKR